MGWLVGGSVREWVIVRGWWCARVGKWCVRVTPYPDKIISESAKNIKVRLVCYIVPRTSTMYMHSSRWLAVLWGPWWDLMSIALCRHLDGAIFTSLYHERCSGGAKHRSSILVVWCLGRCFNWHFHLQVAHGLELNGTHEYDLHIFARPYGSRTEHWAPMEHSGRTLPLLFGLTLFVTAFNSYI